MHSGGINLGGAHSGGDTLLARRPLEDDAEFDITAMIDLVFMMNIYFLVTFVTAAMGEINLPAANHAVSLDSDKAAIITAVAGPDWKTVYVYLGDGKKGTPLAEPDDQANQIASYVDK